MMKLITNNRMWARLHAITRTVLMLGIALAVIYSFLYMPYTTRQAKLNCNGYAIAATQSAVEQVNTANQNLAAGQQPAQINEVSVYDTQYTLCLRSNGL